MIERADKLRQSADESARLVRTLFFGFVALGAYIGVTIASTTDVQLLKISPVRLPLLNVDIPIVGFYLVTPLLFVLAHFNLLLQFHLLARKLHAFDVAVTRLSEQQRADQRERMFPLAFGQMLAGRHHGPLMRGLLVLMVWTSTVALPLVLLIWADVRFLPYQDERVTWVQRVAVAVDLVMLLTFWPFILAAGNPTRDWVIPLREYGAGIVESVVKLVVGPFVALVLAAGRRVRPRQIRGSAIVMRR